MIFPRTRSAGFGRTGLLAAIATGAIAGSVVTLSLVSSQDSRTRAILSRAQSILQPEPARAHYPAVDLAEIAERATASVVNISSTKVIRNEPREEPMSPFMEDPFFRRFFQLPPGQSIPQERQAHSLGSGVIVDDEGVVLTNNHVVEGADEIRITLADGRELDAELVGSDPQSDVAVIRIKGDPSGLKPLPIGDSSGLRLADTVLAIGNPFGVGQTVTMGIVSATGRANLGIADYEDFIQTDAAINPGNSGGALLNTKGELIGINTAIVSRTGGYQGVGFAIPSNMARTIMTSLMTTGKVERGWLGVSIQTLDRDIADAMGIEQAHGVLVSDIVAESPAKKAGIERGDVILALDGKEVRTTGELRNIVAAHPAGESVAVTVLREGKKREIDVELGTLADNAAAPKQAAPGKMTGGGLLGGLAVSELLTPLRKKFDIADKIDSGVVVTEIDPRSAPAKAGIAPGDVIMQVDQKPVTSVDDFRSIADKLDGKSCLVLVARENGTAFVLVKK